MIRSAVSACIARQSCTVLPAGGASQATSPACFVHGMARTCDRHLQKIQSYVYICAQHWVGGCRACASESVGGALAIWPGIANVVGIAAYRQVHCRRNAVVLQEEQEQQHSAVGASPLSHCMFGLSGVVAVAEHGACGCALHRPSAAIPALDCGHWQSVRCTLHTALIPLARQQAFVRMWLRSFTAGPGHRLFAHAASIGVVDSSKTALAYMLLHCASALALPAPHALLYWLAGVETGRMSRSHW